LLPLPRRIAFSETLNQVFLAAASVRADHRVVEICVFFVTVATLEKSTVQK